MIIRLLNLRKKVYQLIQYIITGHSKGANLSLVGSMNINILKQNRISKVYSFDGPGLRKKEYRSYKFKYIKRKVVSIIPNYAVVGLLLNNSNDYKIVESKKKGILAHSIYNWRVNDKSFVYTNKLSTFSIGLDKIITKWIDNYSDKEKKELVDDLFSIFDRCNIESLERIHAADIKAILLMLKESKNISSETKSMIKDFISILFDVIKEDTFTFIKSKQ